MIYQCQYCGWRINERKYCKENTEEIGKCLLYNNRTFCSERCIELVKNKPYVLSNDKPFLNPYDWSKETANWKTERKIGRKRKMRKLYHILNSSNKIHV